MNLFKGSFRVTKKEETSNEPPLTWKQSALYAIAGIAIILVGALYLAITNEQGVEVPNAVKWIFWIVLLAAAAHVFSKMNRRIGRK